MDDYLNIAIDGPAGAGKSTIAKAIANKLGILYLDTGAMYRAMAFKALQMGIVPGDRDAVLPILQDTDIMAVNEAGVQHTYLDGKDVSGLIRTQEVAKGASDISAIPEVRIKLVELQRKVATSSHVVMDGRDIGSYVIPHTKYKFYVTASAEERAKRRLLELQEKGQYLDRDLQFVIDEIVQRDKNDSTRKFAPLTRVADAALIDTTAMDIPTAVNAVLSLLPSEVKQ